MSKPYISAEALLRTAWRMRAARVLPAPQDVDVRRVVDAGGVRPWIREVIGAEAAVAIEAEGKGGWHLGAMMGVAVKGRREASCVDYDEAEIPYLVVLDAACSFADSTTGSSYATVVDDYCRFNDWPEMLAFMEGLKSRLVDVGPRLHRKGRRAGLGDGCRAVSGLVLREAARLLGVDLSVTPSVAPMPVTSTVETAKIVEIRRPSTVAHGFDRKPEYVLEALDGHRWDFLDRYGSLDYRSRYVHVDAVVDVTTKGVMPGFRGYVLRVETHGERDWMAGIKALVAPPSRLPDALDVDGLPIRERDRVELLHDCLEANACSRGIVVETVGDMAVVDFGRDQEPVPCYGTALRRLASLPTRGPRRVMPQAVGA